MKSSLINTGKQAGCMAIILLSAWACQKDGVAPTTQNQTAIAATTAAENTQMMATAIDVFDATATGLNNKGVGNGRIQSFGSRSANNDFLCLPGVSGDFKVATAGDSTIFSGTLVIDYGNGLYCNDSTEFHKGKITDAYRLVLRQHDDDWYTLTESVTFEGFEKDSVQIDGKFISTSSRTTNTITIQNASLRYEDGSVASLNAALTCVQSNGKNQGEGSHHDGSKEVSGSFDGKTREGVVFSAVTTNNVVFDYNCTRAYPVSGTINLTINGSSSTIDYGSGTCDNQYTVTVNDSTTTHTFWKKQNHQHGH